MGNRNALVVNDAIKDPRPSCISFLFCWFVVIILASRQRDVLVWFHFVSIFVSSRYIDLNFWTLSLTFSGCPVRWKSSYFEELSLMNVLYQGYKKRIRILRHPFCFFCWFCQVEIQSFLACKTKSINNIKFSINFICDIRLSFKLKKLWRLNWSKALW